MGDIDQMIANTARVVERFHRRLGLFALLLLCLAVYLPGVIRLPAVDRTEVVFAETTRDMLARGTLTDPRYGETVHQFRPIGTYWAQAKLAWLAGPDHARDIWVYRIPGMLSVSLAVLALYLLAAPLVGGTAALIAAGLFAVAPLTVLDAHLAIAEGLTLLPATVAMLCLLRIYSASREDSTRPLVLLFWAALGIGMLINALLVPILVLVTLIALRFMDRDFWWMQRLAIGSGLPLALLIAAPWIIVRALQDGVPFAGMNFRELLAALGGSQDMKLRAMPGTFVLAACLGFLPGTALLAPALAKLWGNRAALSQDAKIARFLLAWVLGYIVYLEAVSSKPGTYMVQPMFPALALSVGMLVASWPEKVPPKGHAILWPPLAALFAAALFAAPYAAAGAWPALWLWVPMLSVVGLFATSAAVGRAGNLTRWAQLSIAALGLFAVTLIAGVMPSIEKIWPARQVQRALAVCPPARLGVLGFNEPTSHFVLARDAVLSSAKGLAAVADGSVEGRVAVSSAWLAQNPNALTSGQNAKLRPLACVSAVNTMRGCSVNLTVVGSSAAPACETAPEFACTGGFLQQSGAPGLKPCD